MLKKTSALTALTLLVGMAFGQNDFRNGFIITLEGDTIKGGVNYRTSAKIYESCKFKNDLGTVEYLPNQIMGYGFNEGRFFTSEISDSAFVEALVEGKLNLYKTRDRYLVRKDTTIHELKSDAEKVKIDGKVGTLEKSNWRGILTFLISDCIKNPGTATSYVRYDEKSLTQLMVRYNKCSGEDYRDFKEKIPWAETKVGWILGIANSSLSISRDPIFRPENLEDAYTSTNPSIGIVFNVSTPRISDKVSFQGEVQFSRFRSSSIINEEDFNPDVFQSITYKTTVETNIISIPISVLYTFSKKENGLFFQAGLNSDLYLNPNANHITTRVTNEEVFVSEINAFDISSFRIGYWGGVGINKSFKNYKTSISIRYLQMPSINKDVAMQADLRRFSLNLILSKK